MSKIRVDIETKKCTRTYEWFPDKKYWVCVKSSMGRDLALYVIADPDSNKAATDKALELGLLTIADLKLYNDIKFVENKPKKKYTPKPKGRFIRIL